MSLLKLLLFLLPKSWGGNQSSPCPVNPSYHQFMSHPHPGRAVNIGEVWVYFGGSTPPPPGVGAGGPGRRPPFFLSRHEHQQSHGTSLQGSVPPPRATPKNPPRVTGDPHSIWGGRVKVCSFRPPLPGAELGWGPGFGEGAPGGFSLWSCHFAIFSLHPKPCEAGEAGGPCCRFGV